MTSSAISGIVDIARYPLHQPSSSTVQALLERGRAALEENALFSLPGFVIGSAAQCMSTELEGLVPGSCRYERERIAYAEDEPTWADNHPRNVLHPCSYHQVLNYQIPNDSLLRQLFYWEPLRAFLHQIMGYETFFRSECPHLSLTAKIASTGDTDGWHFDSNDVVFSILLQEPVAGGQFEYAPHIRSPVDENYDAIRAAFDGSSSGIRRPRMAVGDLTVFRGDESLHRVTPVEGARRRIVALFSYDRKPGMVFERAYIDELHANSP